MARPERFELPTFWFVGKRQAQLRTTATNKTLKTLRGTLNANCSGLLLSAAVHGQKADRGGGALAWR